VDTVNVDVLDVLNVVIAEKINHQKFLSFFVLSFVFSFYLFVLSFHFVFCLLSDQSLRVKDQTLNLPCRITDLPCILADHVAHVPALGNL